MRAHLDPDGSRSDGALMTRWVWAAVTPRALRIAVLSVAGVGVWSCDSDPPLVFEGKVGEQCYDCEECKHNVVGKCICETCTEFGYDPATKQLLQCSASSQWTLQANCPGGVSVSCKGPNYVISCLDANGAQVPL